MTSDATHQRIQLAHGGGGRLSRDLIKDEILKRLGSDAGVPLLDSATLPLSGSSVLFTTDSFVVQPIFFPGGNIGDLAVHGTVNDIAVAGGRPRWLSLALILEEGLSISALAQVLDAIRSAADHCGVKIVTGDTKVVGHGQCDGLYINTAGIGEPIPGFALDQDHIRAGDQVVVSGTLADHGFAVLACREEISIQNGPSSDTAPVHELVGALQPLAPEIRFMRDPTRGGLAAVLNEVVEDRPFGMELTEQDIPLSIGVRAVSELLGLDPLHVASEGRVVAICSPDASQAVCDAWKSVPGGAHAAIIGRVTESAGRVILRSVTGGRRVVNVPRGELLPRIC